MNTPDVDDLLPADVSADAVLRGFCSWFADNARTRRAGGGAEIEFPVSACAGERVRLMVRRQETGLFLVTDDGGTGARLCAVMDKRKWPKFSRRVVAAVVRGSGARYGGEGRFPAIHLQANRHNLPIQISLVLQAVAAAEATRWLIPKGFWSALP